MTTHIASSRFVEETLALSKGLLFILTIGASLSVANIYYNQPMLAVLAQEFHSSASVMSLIPVLSQAGYALGIFFLSPLGDKFERKTLILSTMVGLTLALIMTAMSPSIGWLAGASLLTGLMATVTQQIVPLAVHLAKPQERGKVIGVVTGGILLGILLARTAGGYVTDHFGWRSMYWIATCLMGMTTLAMALKLPRVEPAERIGYFRVMASLGTLFMRHGLLRRAALVQSLMFGAFLAFWATLAQLFNQPTWHLGATEVGLMGVIGAGGALIAPVAGKIADRRGPKLVVSLGAALLVVAFLLLGLVQNSIAALIIAVILMDLAVQASQVSNQAQVYSLDPTARSRLNTIFMTAMFMGGAIGSAVGNVAFSHYQWSGTCAVAGFAGLLALWASLKKIRA